MATPLMLNEKESFEALFQLGEIKIIVSTMVTTGHCLLLVSPEDFHKIYKKYEKKEQNENNQT